MFTIIQVPLVPLTPGASILFNVFLMMKLSFLTWIRFTVWIAIGKTTSELMQTMLWKLKNILPLLPMLQCIPAKNVYLLPNLNSEHMDLTLHRRFVQLSLHTNAGRQCYLRKQFEYTTIKHLPFVSHELNEAQISVALPCLLVLKYLLIHKNFLLAVL